MVEKISVSQNMLGWRLSMLEYIETRSVKEFNLINKVSLYYDKRSNNLFIN